MQARSEPATERKSRRENVTDDYSTTLDVILLALRCRLPASSNINIKKMKKARIIKSALINFRFRTIKMTAIDCAVAGGCVHVKMQ